MKQATIQISAELLRDLLQFPEDVEIVGGDTGNVELTVRSERIPEGQSEVLAVWIKKGQHMEPEFLRFEPTRNPAEPLRI